MAKEIEWVESFTAKDEGGDTCTIHIYQEYAVNGDVKIPTYKHFKMDDGTVAKPQPDGSFVLLGFGQIQVWKECEQ